jgi:hypothetical protein
VARLALLWFAAAGCTFRTNATSPAPGVDALSSSEPAPADAQPIDADPIDAAVSVDASVQGALAATVLSFGNGNVDLTNEGTLDWAHWGYGGANGFDHKATGTALTDASATVTKVAIGSVTATATWSDGTPHQSATNVGTGVGVQAPGVLQLTIPAGVQPRTLRLYCGNKNSTARLDVALGDGSAPAYSDTQTASGAALHLEYTITFNAASDGQTLNVSWTDVNDSGGGFAMLMSATLE